MKRHNHRVSQLRRRDILALSASAGVGLLSWPSWIPTLTAAPRTFPEPSFAPGAIIRTILKDIPPSAIAGGATLVHEHISNRPYSKDIDLMLDELKASAQDGVRCIVDGGSIGSIEEATKIAAKSPVEIVFAGGYYLSSRYPPEVAAESAEQLTERLVAQARTQRWGAFGEIGTSRPLHQDERKVLRAIGNASVRTGLPVFTHTPHEGCASCALEQLDVFATVGVRPSSLCIGHLSDIGDEPNADTAKTLAKRGVFVGFDTVGHQITDVTHAQKVAMILALLDAGYEEQILLASDLAREPHLKRNWGPGYSLVLAVFVPKLRHAGVSEEIIHKILVDNPRRFLAFVPNAH